MFEKEDRIGVCSFNFRTSGKVIDPLNENMYSQVSKWLLPVIEDVFSKGIFRDYRIKIDRMEIDLGKILCSENSLRDIQPHFHSALENELIKRIERSDTGSDAAEVMTHKKARIYLFMEYLQFGIFTQRHNGNPQELFNEILKDDIADFVEILRKTKNRNDVIRRLAWQFDIDSIEKTAAALQPSEREFLIEFISQAKTQNKIKDKKNEKQLESDSSFFHRQILEFTFQYFLLEGSVQFNRIDFIESIIRKLTSHYNIGFLSFLNALMSSIKMINSDRKIKKELHILLDEINSRYKTGKKNEEIERESFEKIAQKFIRSLQSDTLHEETIRLWDTMHFKWHEKIMNFMIECLTDAQQIRNLVAVFDRRRIKECITVLCPQGSEFIGQFTVAAEENLPKALMQIKRYNDGFTPLRQQVLEFIIRYLLYRDGGAFNELEFTRNILASVAAQHNTDFSELLEAVLCCISKSSEYPEKYKTLRLVLEVLINEHNKKNKKGIEKEKNTNISELIPEELVRMLWRFLKGITEENGMSTVMDMRMASEVIEMLYNKAPDILQKMLEETGMQKSLLSSIEKMHGRKMVELLHGYYVKTENKKKVVEVCPFCGFNESEILYTDDKIIAFENVVNKRYLEILNNENATELNGDELVSLGFATLWKYLEYFIIKGKDYINNRINRDRLLNVLQSRYSSQFTNELKKTIKEKPHLYRYINNDCFIINKNTIRLIAGINEDDSNGVLVYELFKKIKECRMISDIAALKQMIDSAADENNHDVNKIIHIADTCGNMEIWKWLFYEVGRKTVAGKVINEWNEIRMHYERIIEKEFDDTVTERPQQNISESAGNTDKNQSDMQKDKLKRVKDKTAETIEYVDRNGDDIISFLEKLSDAAEKKTEYIAGSILSEMESIIVNKPQALLEQIICRGNSLQIISTMIKYMSENMFFRFLNCASGNLGIRTYYCYKAMRTFINSKITGEETGKYTEKLMIIFLTELVNNYNGFSDIEKFFITVLQKFTLNMNETDRFDTVSFVLSEIVKQGNLPFIKDSQQVKETLYNRIQVRSDCIKEIVHNEDKKEEMKSAPKTQIAEEDLPEEMHVENAGMVIGAPYFERLFNMLGLTEDKKFKDCESVNKALKILHYFSGKKTECFEDSLLLNKIFCGQDITWHADIYTELTDDEKGKTDGLVDAIIRNWTKLNGTSPEGMRQSFLQRSGTIRKNDNGWLLKIDNRSFDMLIDTLPWGISMIKYPWMKGLLQVEWKWI